MKKLLIVLSGGLGDVLLCTPVFEALKTRYPGGIVHVAGQPEQLQVLQNNPFIDELFTMSPEFIQQRVRVPVAERYDGMYETLPPFGLLKPEPMVRRMLEMCHASDAGIEPRLQVYLSDAERARSSSLMSGFNRPVIIHTSYFNKPPYGRILPASFWNQLIGALPDIQFVQVGEPGDLQLAQASNLADLRGRTSVRETVGMAAHAWFHVCVDSFVQHACAVFGIRGVTLWGASDPRVYGHDINVNIWNPPACSPCREEQWVHTVILGRRDPFPCCQTSGINTIEVEEVLAAIEGLRVTQAPH